MNCESWLEPKNSFIAAVTGRILMRLEGITTSMSCEPMRSLTTRSKRVRPTRI